MSQQEIPWAQRLAGGVGRRVRAFRTERGLSAQALADRCAQLGYDLKRSVLAEMENGKRATVSVADVLVLARALGVPPLALILDLGEPFEAGPIEMLDGWAGYEWLTGGRPPERVPPWIDDDQERIKELQSFAESSEPLRRKREYEQTAANVFIHRFHAAAYRAREAKAPDDEKTMLAMLAIRETELAMSSEEELEMIKWLLKGRGVTPPPLGHGHGEEG